MRREEQPRHNLLNRPSFLCNMMVEASCMGVVFLKNKKGKRPRMILKEKLLQTANDLKLGQMIDYLQVGQPPEIYSQSYNRFC